MTDRDKVNKFGNTNQGSDTTAGDFKPNQRGSGDIASKQHDYISDRLDSGIESYVSIEDGYSSVTSHISNMSIKNASHNTSIQPDDRQQDNVKAAILTDEQQDSGYQSTSLTEEQIQRIRSTPSSESKLDAAENEALNEEAEFAATLPWFLPDVDGDTCLQLAIIRKNADLTFNIIQMCTLPALLDISNANCQTPLHLAVLTDQPQLVRCLVAYGANLTCRDKQGNTPLHIACERGLGVHVDMLTSPLDPEEDPGFQTTSLPQNVNERNYLGFTPLHLAALNNRAHLIKFLLKQLHCDVNLPDLRSGRTALHHAIERRNIESTRTILESKPDVNALTYDEYSPLHLAASCGLRNEVSALLDHEADLYLITRDDQDVFELASHNRRVYNLLKEVEKRRKRAG